MRAPTFKEIGGRIRELREQKGLSQETLAKSIGVSRPVFTKIETGGRAINSIELAKIATVLDTGVNKLTEGIEEQSVIKRYRAGKDVDDLFLADIEKIESLFNLMKGQLKLGGLI